MTDPNGLDPGDDGGGGMSGGPAGVWSPTSAGGPCFMCGLNNAALYGLQPMGNSLANMEVQSETSYLAGGGVPWYSIQGGNLTLRSFSGWTFVTNPDFNPDDPSSSQGSMVGTVTLWDLGPISTLVALTQQQYIEPISFATALVQDFSVFGPSKTKPSCFGNFLKETGSGLVGVPGVETGAAVGGGYYGFSALFGSAPPVSRALRGGMSVNQWISADNAARLSDAGAAGLLYNLTSSGIPALINEASSAAAGQCD